MSAGARAAPARVRALRVVFFGTPEFAVPALAALAESRHHVVGVISQPDRPRGRGRRLEPTPVHAEAERRGLDLLQRESVGDEHALAWLRSREPDLGCVVAFGQFIPKSVRELPSHGLVNAHASLLPRWRGAAPIQHALLAGDATTGITVMRVEREMDAGDCCLKRELEIGPDETAGELAERLAALAGQALLEAVDAMAAGTARFEPQNPAGVTLAPKLERAFGRLDWTRPAAELLCRIRAATPWPGADVALRPGGLRFRILRARLDSSGGPPPRPGRVQRDAAQLRIAALDGWIAVQRLQVPGRRAVETAEFLRGARAPTEPEEVHTP